MNIIQRPMETKNNVTQAGAHMLANAGAVSLIVLAAAVSAVAAAPTISSISPTATYVGYAVTITGTNFGPSQGSSTVTFNGTAAVPSSWRSNGTSIVVHVPAAATTGSVVVTVGGVPSNGVLFSVTPQVNTLSTNTGPVTTSVTITGTGFGATQPGGTPVTFNGTGATPVGWSATSIVVPVPLGATTGPVTVTLSGVPSNSKTFTVTPGITGLSLTTGPVQMGLVITGTNLGSSQGSSTVTLNTTKMTIVSWSAPSCTPGYSCVTVQVPAGATTGTIVVTVNNKASNGSNFTVSSAFGCS
jgi:hypothetical protein